MTAARIATKPCPACRALFAFDPRYAPPPLVCAVCLRVVNRVRGFELELASLTAPYGQVVRQTRRRKRRR